MHKGIYMNYKLTEKEEETYNKLKKDKELKKQRKFMRVTKVASIL